MKFISFGKINSKFFLYLLFFVIVAIFLDWISNYLPKQKDKIKNVILNILINFFGFVFFGIPEYIIKKKYYSRKNADTKINNNKLVYIYNNPNKKNYKNLIILIILITLDYEYLNSNNIFVIKYPQYFKFVFGEYFNVILILYFYLIYRIIHKTTFYKHQYLSLVILITLGFIRCSIQLFYFDGIRFDFPVDLLYFSYLFIHSIPLSLKFYVPDYFVRNKYYSILFILCITGAIFTICSIILLSIFLNINIEESSIFSIFLIKDEIPSTFIIVVYLFRSILYALYYFFLMKTINDFSIFHIIILLFFEEFISNILGVSEDLDIGKLIFIIISFPFEILIIFVFVEIIELNFWGLNLNLKRNIINRERDEINLLNEISDKESDTNSNSENNSSIELSSNSSIND